jgi:4a-hydroxytetrahydrobiopterin dehydratase
VSSGFGAATIRWPIVLSGHTGAVTIPEHWSEVDGALERTFELDDFAAALAFVNRVGQLAESENHHPDIAIHYNKVTLRWWTHTAGGITDRDRDLAARSGELG